MKFSSSSSVAAPTAKAFWDTFSSISASLTTRLAVTAVALSMSALSVSAAMTQGKIEVGAVHGNATVSIGNGAATPLMKGSVINSGAKVYCANNASAELYFANGARVIVQPSSNVLISKFDIEQNSKVPATGFDKLSGEPSYSSTLLNVERGKVLVEVQKLRTPISDFRVRTPFVSVDVKGTAFFVEQTSAFAKVGNLRGSVAVNPVAQLGAPVTLAPEQTVTYRMQQGEGNTYDGVFGGVQRMDRAEYNDAVAQLSGGVVSPSDSAMAGENKGPERSKEVDGMIDNPLIIVSPNGGGQTP